MSKHFNIKIDKEHFKVEQGTMTGAELKILGNVPSEYELWLNVPGEEDKLITNDQVVTLEPGMKFISVPSNITPGGVG